MRNDGFDRLDVRNALRGGAVVEVQYHADEPRYVVTGTDTEGRTITAVVEAEERVLKIVVVTAWKGKR